MRKIIVFNLISLDGFFAGVDGNIDWHNVDEEFNDFAIEQTASFGGLIFGKTTYQLFEQFWPKAMIDPKTSPKDRKIAEIIDTMWKLVFSKTLKEVTWKNSQLYHDIDPKEIKKWKLYDGKDLAIFGSGSIVTQFSNGGLIDEYRILVNPIILGEGKSFFKGMKEKKISINYLANF